MKASALVCPAVAHTHSDVLLWSLSETDICTHECEKHSKRGTSIDTPLQTKSMLGKQTNALITSIIHGLGRRPIQPQCIFEALNGHAWHHPKNHMQMQKKNPTAPLLRGHQATRDLFEHCSIDLCCFSSQYWASCFSSPEYDVCSFLQGGIFYHPQAGCSRSAGARMGIKNIKMDYISSLCPMNRKP